MANTFPTIQTPDYPLQETKTDHTLKMQVDNETILTRPRFTKMPRAFKLTWSKLPTADYNLLRSFYDSMHGGSLAFQWAYPNDPGNDYSGKTFTVRFDNESLDFQLVEMDYWNGSVTLKEV